MVNSVLIFLLGMVGALAPEIVRLYAIRNDPSRFKWSWFYLGISAAFAALGGVLALVLPATTYWGAIYVGVSTPLLVNSIVRKGRDLTRPELRSLPSRVTKLSFVDSYLEGL